VGSPGTGKSTLSLHIIRGWQAECAAAGRDCYAFVYEGQGTFPRFGGDGMRLSFVHEHRTVDAAKRALATRPGGIHIIQDTTGLDVLWLAEEVAARTGGYAICWWDEIAWVDGANNASEKLDRRLRKLLAVMRHRRVALGWGSQSPGWAHLDLRRLTNMWWLLRISEQSDIQALGRGGVPSSILAWVPRLRNFKHLHHNRDV